MLIQHAMRGSKNRGKILMMFPWNQMVWQSLATILTHAGNKEVLAKYVNEILI